MLVVADFPANQLQFYDSFHSHRSDVLQVC